MKICPVGAKLFHAEGLTEKHDEGNFRISPFCVGALGPQAPASKPVYATRRLARHLQNTKEKF
jgi:hypothetical protein